MLIFHHNITGRVYFANEQEALNCHEDQKYSILSAINESMKYQGKYEFLLQYGSSATKFNRWRQSLHPVEQEEGLSTGKVPGFEDKGISFNQFNFGGLAKTSIKDTCINSFLNGVVDKTADWYYAIGQYKPCNTNWLDYIPGDYGSIQKLETVVDLWIRISPFVPYCSCKTNKHIKFFNFIFLLDK